MDSEIQDTLNTGDEVEVTGISEDRKWSSVKYDGGKTGYVDNEYLVGEDRVEKRKDGVLLIQAEKELYAAVGVYVRKDCTKDSEALGILEEGDMVKATGVCSNGWVRVEYEKADAYVYGEYLSTDEPGRETRSSADEEWADTVYSSHTEQEDVSVKDTGQTVEDDGLSYEEWLGETFGYDENGDPIDPYPHSNAPSDEGYEEWLEKNGY